MNKILFVSSDNSYTSGAFLCMVKFCELLKKDYDVCVILPKEGDGTPLLDEAGIKYEIIESKTWTYAEGASLYQKGRMVPRFIKYNHRAIKKIREIILERKIDIVHINTIWSYVGAVAALKENVKLIWHIREQIQEQDRNILFKNLGYKLINKSDKIITVSDYLSKSYVLLDPSKIEIVYDGIDESIFYSDRDIFQNKKIRLLNIGYMIEQKSQETIIRACDCLIRKGFDSFTLDFVGDGEPEYIGKMKKLTDSLGLNDVIHFCGPTHDTTDYYRNSDIFIMASHSEAFGRTTVEAMMSGCVVIGADSGATPEILGNGEYGYLYEYDNCEELSDTIINVVRNKSEAQKKAKNGQGFATQKFSAYNNLRNVEKIYEKL